MCFFELNTGQPHGRGEAEILAERERLDAAPAQDIIKNRFRKVLANLPLFSPEVKHVFCVLGREEEDEIAVEADVAEAGLVCC